MGICTSVSRKSKVIEANQMNKKDFDINTNSAAFNKENSNNNQENKNNGSLISDKNSDEKDIKSPEKEKNNYPDILINYMSNGKLELEQIFKTEDKVSNLFDILLEKKSKYAEYDLIANDKVSLLDKINEKISTIFPNTENAEVNMIYLGLDISDDVKSEYESSFDVIGTPLYDLGENLGILIYNIKDNSFSAHIIENKKLNKFNQLSSICNMKNILYLSGGDEQKNNTGKNKPTDYFCSIDLFNLNKIAELPSLNTRRCFHSMIYIPKKYIFIVGGGTLDVEYYDVKNNKIILDSKTKEIRNETTLMVMNNCILYAFGGMSPDGTFLTTVEKCNLGQKERTWSFVNYSTADNAFFQDCYYTGHYFSDTSIILFASNEGENNEYFNIMFDLEDEENPTISNYEGDKIVDVIPEKIFHPLGDGTAVMIPLIGTLAQIYKIDESTKLNVETFPEAMKNII